MKPETSLPKIIVLGSRGMLGQMVFDYFRTRAEVVVVDERHDFSRNGAALKALQNAGPGIVINCIGLIRQKSADTNDLLLANAVLPLQIYDSLSAGQFLVQPSTDCVFSGQTSSDYHWDAPCDASDMYGWSKRLGELALAGKERACVVRVSIVGIDRLSKDPKGLLGWFLSNPPRAKLSGYTDHFWNGITTLEWCRLVEDQIISDGGRAWAGRLLQIASPHAVSKFELLQIFQDHFATEYTISPVESDHARRMCLLPMITARDIPLQIADLANSRFNATSAKPSVKE